MPPWIIALIAVAAVGGLGFLWIESRPQHKFIDAAGNADIAKLRAWLDKGVDVNLPGFMGLTALNAAVQEGRLENVKLLLERGADPNLISMKQLPLGLAASENKNEIVACLLEHGADFNKTSFLKVTPLQEAMTAGNCEAMKMFIDRGADVNGKSSFGDPLLSSLLLTLVGTRGEDGRAKLRAMVRLLLDHGANPNVRMTTGVPAIMIAIEDPLTLRLMVENGSITQTSYDGIDLEPEIQAALATLEP